MVATRFTVQVKDLDYGDRDLDEEIPVEWLASALEDTEAKPANRAGRLTATLSKTGRQVMVRGRAEATVVMPCARTMDPVEVPLAADLFLLLSPRAETPSAAKGKRRRETLGAVARAARKEGNRVSADEAGGLGERQRAGGPIRRREGGRRSAPPQDEPELTADEAAEDTFDGEKVVLDGFIREFLLLELPLVPLREDLRSTGTPAIDVPPERSEPSESQAERAIDPRLQPLAALANRLRDEISKKE